MSESLVPKMTTVTARALHSNAEIHSEKMWVFRQALKTDSEDALTMC